MKTPVAVALLALSVAGCGLRPAEADSVRTLLNQFFAASRLRDLTALRAFGTVVFEPTRDGMVTSFEIVEIKRRGTARDVSIAAPVRLPDGRTAGKRYTVTIEGGLVTAITEQVPPSPLEQPASPSPPRR